MSLRNMMVAGLSSPLLGGGGSGWEKPLAPEGTRLSGHVPNAWVPGAQDTPQGMRAGGHTYVPLGESPTAHSSLPGPPTSPFASAGARPSQAPTHHREAPCRTAPGLAEKGEQAGGGHELHWPSRGHVFPQSSREVEAAESGGGAGI